MKYIPIYTTVDLSTISDKGSSHNENEVLNLKYSKTILQELHLAMKSVFHVSI